MSDRAHGHHGHLSDAERRGVFELLQRGLKPAQIAARVGISPKNAQAYYRQWMRGEVCDSLARADIGLHIRRLCLVDECHDPIVSGTKYCAVHAPKPPGTISEFIAAPSLARLMAGR